MELLGELAERLLDLVRARAPRNAQFLVGIARKRIDGDRWDGDGEDGGPSRFRVRVLDGLDAVRAFEIEGAAATYAAADVAEDFPAGLSDDSRALVAQWGDGYGWGLEASIRLAG